MTKKDYKAIGQAIRDAEYWADHPAASDQTIRIMVTVADVFERDNARFDRQRFYRFVRTGKDTR